MQESKMVIPERQKPEPMSVKINPVKIPEGAKKIQNYILGKTIGNGMFGKVHLGLNISTGEKVAVKIIQKSKLSVKDIENVKKEVKILKKIAHPNIVQLYQILETEKSLLHITQFLPNGELFHQIQKNKRLDESKACKFFNQIIDAIQYLHTIGIAHRDLKPENILIDEYGNAKIIDFSLSNLYKKNGKLKTSCGSPCYAAPEIIDGKASYNPLKGDIWSCGIILYVMVCGSLPFCDSDTAKLYKKILIGNFKIPDFLSNEVRSLIRKILTVNPSQRISLQSIRKNNWFRSINHNKVSGIFIDQYYVPIEEKITQKMVQEGLILKEEKKQFVQDLKDNQKTPKTAIYYLIVRKLLRQNYEIRMFYGSKQFDAFCLDRRSEIQQAFSTDEGGSATMIEKPGNNPFSEKKFCLKKMEEDVVQIIDIFDKEDIPSANKRQRSIFYSFNKQNQQKRHHLNLQNEQHPQTKSNRIFLKKLNRPSLREMKNKFETLNRKKSLFQEKKSTSVSLTIEVREIKKIRKLQPIVRRSTKKYTDK